MTKGKKIDENNVFDKDNKPYSWILNLLISFDETGMGGLTRKQLVYVLVKNYDIYNLKEAPKKIREFFSNLGTMELIYSLHFQLDWVIPNSIESAKDLDDKLRRLRKLKMIEPTGSGKKIKYCINKSFSSEVCRIQYQKYLNCFKPDQILKIPEKSNEPMNVVLFGVSKELYKSKEKELNSHISEITKHLNEIKKIKLMTMKKKYLKILDKICDEFNNTKLREYVNNNWWPLFCYFTFRNFGSNLNKLDFADNKNLEMSSEEKRDFLKKIYKRTKEIYDEYTPIDIALLHYP